ncbi:MAG TPA: hypothetical protein VGM10_19615 [Actinocrinis sp.]
MFVRGLDERLDPGNLGATLAIERNSRRTGAGVHEVVLETARGHIDITAFS